MLACGSLAAPLAAQAQQAGKICRERAVNFKTAKTLGLTIPQSLLSRADELIQ